MDDVNVQLRYGKTQVIDADISKYFDNIPHEKLLALIAKRVVDKNILRLIKMWLKASVVEEESGKKKYKGNDKGTPQGGVISPLLANIYLNVLDAMRILRGIQTVLGDLGLTLNEDKTKVVDAGKDSFNFLGFTIGVKDNPKTGKKFPMIIPSKKALRHIKMEIKNLTCRSNLVLPKEVVVNKLNEVVRGWVNYFYYGNCSNDLLRLKGYLEERIRTYLRRKHKKSRACGYKDYPQRYMYKILGLYKIPTTTPWTQSAKAYGRR